MRPLQNSLLSHCEERSDVAIFFVFHKLEIASSTKVRQSTLAERTCNDNMGIFKPTTINWAFRSIDVSAL